MADNVIRQDLIQIGFEVDDNPFTNLLDDITKFENLIGETVNSGEKEIKELAKTVNSTSADFTDLTKNTKDLEGALNGIKPDGVSDVIKENEKLKDGLEETKETIKDVSKESSSVKAKGLSGLVQSAIKLGKSKISGFKDNLKELAKTKVEQLSNKLKETIGSSKNLTTAMLKLGAIGFEKTLSGVGKLSKETAKLSVSVGKTLTKGLLVASTGVAVTAAGMFGAVTKEATDFKQSLNSVLAQTGYNEADYGKEFSSTISNLYRDNMGEDYSDIANSLATVANMTGETGKGLENITHNALLMRDTFEFEVSESTRTAQMMMKQFGVSADEAYSLMAQGAQQGLNQNDNLLDSMNEYAVHFKQLGFDATEMMNMFSNGAAKGVFDVDKLGDAVKEFGIRAKDESNTTLEAYKILGLDAKQLTKDFAQGGDAGKKAFEQVTSALAKMDDPVKQNLAGVNLFGTMWEDVGAKGILAMSKTTGQIQSGTDALKQLNEIKYDDLGSAMQGIGKTIKNGMLLPIGNQLLPLLNTGANKLQGFADEIASVFDDGFQSGDELKIAEIISKMLDEVAKAISTGLPKIIDFIVPILGNLATSIASMLPSVLPVIVNGAIQLIDSLIDTVLANTNSLASVGVEVASSFAQFLITGIPKVIMSGVQLIIALAQGISGQLPQITQNALLAIATLVQGLLGQAPQLISVALVLVQNIAQGLIGSFPQLLQIGIQIILSVINGITQAIPQIINTVVGLIPQLVVALVQSLPLIIQGGIEIIIALAGGILKGIVHLIAVIPKVVVAIIKGLMETDWIKVGKDLIKGVGKGLLNGAKNLIFGGKEAGKDATDGVVSGITESTTQVQNSGQTLANSFTSGIDSSSYLAQSSGENLANATTLGLQTSVNNSTQLGTQMVDNFATGVQNNSANAVGAVNTLSSQLQTAGNTEVALKVNADTKSINNVTSSLKGLVKVANSTGKQFSATMAQSFTSASKTVITNTGKMNLTFTTGMMKILLTAKTTASGIKSTMASVDLYSSGANIMNGLLNGINSKRGAIMSTAQSIAREISTTINTELDIHSPSRKMVWSGNMVGAGMVKGIQQSTPDVYKSANDMVNATVEGATPVSNNYSTTRTQNSSTTYYQPQYTIQVQGSPDKASLYKIKKIVKETIQESYESIGRKKNPITAL